MSPACDRRHEEPDHPLIGSIALRGDRRGHRDFLALLLGHRRGHRDLGVARIAAEDVRASHGSPHCRAASSLASTVVSAAIRDPERRTSTSPRRRSTVKAVPRCRCGFRRRCPGLHQLSEHFGDLVQHDNSPSGYGPSTCDGDPRSTGAPLLVSPRRQLVAAVPLFAIVGSMVLFFWAVTKSARAFGASPA